MGLLFLLKGLGGLYLIHYRNEITEGNEGSWSQDEDKRSVFLGEERRAKHLASAQQLAHSSQKGEGKREADTHAYAVAYAAHHAVLGGKGLGTTSSAINGMSMGLATMAVLIFSNLIISLIKNLIPDKVRIPSFIVVIASLVTILQMLIKAYAPEVDKSLGLFIPLIVVNCIILGRAEAFAAKNGVVSSICDGIGMGIGFTLALTLLGAVRELLGTGKVFNTTLFPEEYGALVFVLAPGAFIALGYLIAIFNKIKKA